MRTSSLVALFCCVLIDSPLRAEVASGANLIDRVGDTGFVRVDVDSFSTLNPRQQELAYWLREAAIAVDPIVYEQFSRYGLRQKRLLEGIVAHPTGDPAEAKILAYTKLFWANRGNHNDTTARKFLPGLTPEELARAAHAARAKGAFAAGCAYLPPLLSAAALDRELQELEPSLFDASFEPMLTAKTPAPGQDILRASSNTFYENLSLADLNGIVETHRLNSRLVKSVDGRLHEVIYRAGTPDGRIPPGLYAPFLRKANGYLARARAVADRDQAQVISALIRYYQTGDSTDWIRFGTLWVQNNAVVDFSNGFVEIYRDARGAKAVVQAFVSITDKPVTATMMRLAANAGYFEARAPWPEKYKKESFTNPTVKAVEMIAETGDFSIITVGDNLPNENVIHEKYGTKNFLITSSSTALEKATGNRAFAEFAATPEVAARDEKFGVEAEALNVALHEVIGHGSGQLGERVKSGAQPFLKEYYSALEEARADLMALWNISDPKLAELGLISNQAEVAKALYDSAAMTVLMQLRRIPVGDTIEEDHQRDRQLIVNFIRARVPGAINVFVRDGRSFIQVVDYSKMREGVGMLLSELMRIKAEGDYAAIKTLVDAYGVHFDPTVRDEVVARFQRLDLPTYWSGVNARLRAERTADGKISAVKLDYPNTPQQQHLEYGAMYDASLR